MHLTSRSAWQSLHYRSEDTSHVPCVYSCQAGDHSTIHALSPTISRALRTIPPGLLSTSWFCPSVTMRFLATTRAPTRGGVHEREVREIDDEGRASHLHPRAVTLNSDDTARPFPPKVAGG